MKKTGLLLLLVLSAIAAAQETTLVETPNAQGIIETAPNVPFVRYQTPTLADIYCSGFMTKEHIADANYVNGGLETPDSTKYGRGEIVYLKGSGYQVGQLYSIVRELHDLNEYELYEGQHKIQAASGNAYADIGRVRILDTRSHSAIAQVELSCDPINPGDVAIPFVEKQPIAFHAPGHFDRFAPPNGKLTGRIVLGKDFDGFLGTGVKLYMNMGSNQGVKVGDYFRVVRSYSETLADPIDALTFKGGTAGGGSEDTQAKPATYEANRFTKGKGPNIHVADFPRRAVGEVVVLNVTPTASSAMVVFALEDIHAGDTVEMDETSN
jgi:hypothetical protein